MSGRNPYTHELLSRVARESKSYVDMLRRLESPLEGGPLSYLKRRVRFYGVDVSHFVDESLSSRPRHRYTKEALEQAAADATGISDVLRRLGVTPYSSAYSHVRRRLDRFGIDTSHFTHGRGASGPLLDADRLAAAVKGAYSIAEVCRRMGLPINGTQRRLVVRSLAEHGTDITHFTGQGHSKGKPSIRRKSAAEILVESAPGSSRTQRDRLHRALQEIGVRYRCAECGTGAEWHGKPITLEIDHINGSRLDNTVGNLRYLCPSCHSQTPTYCRRPAGRGARVTSGPVPQLVKRAPV